MKNWRLLVIFFFMSVLSNVIFAAAGAGFALEHIQVDPTDHVAVTRGAKAYQQYCMSCHSMKYMQFDPVINEVGIRTAQMPMKPEEWTGGVAPPDLSLIAQLRTSDWLYTYMHAFYSDPKQPLGTNNLLKPGLTMANVFLGMQGEQRRLALSAVQQSYFSVHPHYYQVLKLKRQGSMTSAQFDQFTHDLVTFLVYASDPKVAIRHQLGKWALGFLVVFFFLTWGLKRIYWRDIH